MDGASHASAQVRGAASDHAQHGMGHEYFVFACDAFQVGLNCGHSARKTVKNGLDVPSLLHGDDSEVISLIDPHHKLLILGNEYSSSERPISMIARGGLHFVSTSEQVVLVDEFFRLLWGHVSVTIESAFQISCKIFHDLLHETGDL